MLVDFDANGLTPDGKYRIVPVEPTPEMLTAAMDRDGAWCQPADDVREGGVIVEHGMSQADCDDLNADTMDGYREIYKLMLAAASPQPAPKEPTADLDALRERFLLPDDFAHLCRFRETIEDDQGYDVPKAAMKRLAEIGVVTGGARGYYSMTAFGSFVSGAWDELPLKTQADHDADFKKKIAAKNGLYLASPKEPQP